MVRDGQKRKMSSSSTSYKSNTSTPNTNKGESPDNLKDTRILPSPTKRKKVTIEPFDSPSKHVRGKKARMPSAPSDNSKKKKVSLVGKYQLEEIPSYAVVVPFYGKTVQTVGCPPSALPFMQEIIDSEGNWNLELMTDLEIMSKLERRSANSGHRALKANPRRGDYTAHQYLVHSTCNIDHIANKMTKASKDYEGPNDHLKSAIFEVSNEDPIYGKGENITVKCSKAFTNEGLVSILRDFLLPDGLKREDYIDVLNDKDEGKARAADAVKFFGVENKEAVIDIIHQYWD